ncbi:carbohydrate esterase family 16 protein [Karstenula rhodostoma CBS 690.94]|uniref:Carbohydrate esterase family 16 protein n=1 Tax=Karstenula rhodostoma CBS 690.94 TaxID=1392251 RepID=A0A9P4PKA3_9PLEO|nr:carbohydrate esterase family 16 protein [Karstenula rhodostoma CBS 690.94]
MDFFLCMLALATAFHIPISTAANTSSDGTKYMVVFGDSYSSTGFWITSGYPSASNPMGNGGSTTSGGLNWAGIVTKQLNTSLLLTYDFAVYGATVDTSLVRGNTPDVKQQVGYFNQYLSNKPSYAPWTSNNLLVAIWIGINDLGNPFWDGTTPPTDKVLDKYFDLVQNLTDSGVKQFAFLTVPPFQNAPSFLQSDTTKLVSSISSWNSALKTKVNEFTGANKGVTAQYIETASSFTTALENPSKYGATDAKCSNPDGTKCLWYDGYHAGQAIHKLVAEAFVRALKGSFF